MGQAIESDGESPAQRLYWVERNRAQHDESDSRTQKDSSRFTTSPAFIFHGTDLSHPSAPRPPRIPLANQAPAEAERGARAAAASTGWAVDQAILAEEERLVIIRFGHDWDQTCMQVTGSSTA